MLRRFFSDGDDDVAYKFDLLFVRRQRHDGGEATLAWDLPPAQTSFSACLWLRMSVTQTEGTVLSFGGQQRIERVSRNTLSQDLYDFSIIVDSHHVVAKYVNYLQFCSFYVYYFSYFCVIKSLVDCQNRDQEIKPRNRVANFGKTQH